MIEYLGNCSHLIDWDKFIKDLETKKSMVGYQYSDDRSQSEDPMVLEVFHLWKQAGYIDNQKSICWEAWYSGKHFDESISQKLCQYLNITAVDTSMVTKLIPGRFAPWHWDIRNTATEQRFDSYQKPIVRVHIHMNKSEPGHVFFVENQVFYDCKQGDMFKWPHWKAWHGGGNCGLVPKYQFSIIGVPI